VRGKVLLAECCIRTVNAAAQRHRKVTGKITGLIEHLSNLSPLKTIEGNGWTVKR
jgi:hypothetical protein